MIPTIFGTVSADAGVAALLGTSPCRFYMFDQAPQSGTAFYALPYAVWQQVGGLPENNLSQRPDVDSYSLQIDVYGRSSSECYAVAEALRDSLELRAHITRWGATDREDETGLYRLDFDVDWWQDR